MKSTAVKGFLLMILILRMSIQLKAQKMYSAKKAFAATLE